VINHCNDLAKERFGHPLPVDGNADAESITAPVLPVWEFEKAREILQAVMQLPEQQRRVIKLRIADPGITLEEIAHEMDLSPDQVRRLRGKARARLERVLGQSPSPRRGRPPRK